MDAAFWVPLVNPHDPLVNPHDVELLSKRLGNYQYNALLGFLADQAWVR